MIKSIFFYILLYLFLFNTNQSKSQYLQLSIKPNHILNKEYKIQALAIDSIKDIILNNKKLNPIEEFNHLENWALKNEDVKLRYTITLSKMKFIFDNDKNDSSFKLNLYKIINTLNENKYYSLKAQGLELLANYYWATKQYAPSLENYLNAYNIYTKFNIDEFPQKAEYLFEIANSYYYFRDFETAKKYYLEVWKTISHDKIDNLVSKLNTIGLCYSNLNMLDSSNYYLIKALENAKQNNKENWIGIISGNLGTNYFIENKIEEAIYFFKKSIEISTLNNVKLDLAITLSKYGAALLIQKKYKEALEAQLNSLDIIHNKHFKDYSITYKIFPNVAKAYAANGNFKKAFLYLDSAYIAKYNYESDRNAVFFSGVQHKIDLEKHKAEIRISEDEIKQQKLLRNLTIGGFIVLLFILGIFYIQQKKYRKTQVKLFLAEKLAVLGQVSAGVAHEVNTPLSAIKSSAEESITAFPEIINELLWTTKNLNENDKVLLFEFIALANPASKTLTTKEEREIKKRINQELLELGIQNSRFISEKLIQVGIHELDSKLVELTKLPNFEKIILFVCNLLNQQKSNLTIQMAVNKASRIVKALKTYLHTSSSEDMELINLKDNLETVLTIYQNRLKQGIQVIKNYDDIPEIYGFPDQLNQVWTNLIVNAVQAMDNKGILTITLKCDSNFVFLSIKDTGKGIPKKIQSKIFDPFFTTKVSGEGSGIGLDISKRILIDHKATISFDSIENEGTTFYVNLPIKS
jgi:signal transduction histidine kinase